MVSRVPPSKGPLRGSICQVTGVGRGSEWGGDITRLGALSNRAHTQGEATQTHCLGEGMEAPRGLGLLVSWQVTGAANEDVHVGYSAHMGLGT